MGPSEFLVSPEQTPRFRHVQKLHKNEIGLDDIEFQFAIDEQYKHVKHQVSGETLLGGSHVKDTCTQRFSQPGRMPSSSLSSLTAWQTCPIQRGLSPFNPSTSSSKSSRLSQMSCFKTRLLSTCLVLEKPNVQRDFHCLRTQTSHCRRSTNNQLSSRVREGRSSSQSTFTSVGQGISLCHQRSATNSSDSCRTLTQNVLNNF